MYDNKWQTNKQTNKQRELTREEGTKGIERKNEISKQQINKRKKEIETERKKERKKEKEINEKKEGTKGDGRKNEEVSQQTKTSIHAYK